MKLRKPLSNCFDGSSFILAPTMKKLLPSKKTVFYKVSGKKVIINVFFLLFWSVDQSIFMQWLSKINTPHTTQKNYYEIVRIL
jgi:hypothetical protein